MGQFIDLRSPTENRSDKEWVIPRELLYYDQNNKPWPNELFRISTSVLPHELQLGRYPRDYYKVWIRRYVNNHLKGDVAFEESFMIDDAGQGSAVWIFWFQFYEDHDEFNLYWKNLCSE